jgi:HAD superfamily hydrolase (TIGR01509 family)
MADASSGVIFDVDGTLVDTNYLHVLAWSRAVHDAGETASMAEIHQLLGMGSDQLVERMLGRPNEEVADGHKAHFRKLTAEIRALPGARDLLSEVHRRGAQVVLATSASEEQLEAMLDALALPDGVVDHRTNKDDVEESKPAPDIFVAAMRESGLEPERCLVVGDTVWDVEAATECGLRVVGVLTGGIGGGALERAGAIAVYQDVGDLLEHLDDSPLAELFDARG